MNLRVAAVSVALLGGAAVVLGSGCRDATQMTIEISLRDAACGEIHGTAITVGVDQLQTEARLQQEYITAATSACDPQNGMIGTLVLTPGDDGRASVIVVVAYDKTNPGSCKAPLYEGCIVARRHFSFSDHKPLRMPISIDPDCKNVPCDAFSTCRTGRCFVAETTCNGDVCVEPGDPGDGGTSVVGEVIPDAGLIDGARPDPDGGGLDASDGGTLPDGAAGTDGGDGGAADGVYCNAQGDLECPTPTVCGATTSCCGIDLKAVCRAGACAGGETRYCCDSNGCPAGKLCFKGATPRLPPPPRPPAPLPVDATAAGTCQ